MHFANWRQPKQVGDTETVKIFAPPLTPLRKRDSAPKSNFLSVQFFNKLNWSFTTRKNMNSAQINRSCPAKVSPTLAPAKAKPAVRDAFAAAFRNWRKRENLPLKQIAADLGVSLATINLWETGKRFPTGQNFERLVTYTGQPPCRLFCMDSGETLPAECQFTWAKQP